MLIVSYIKGYIVFVCVCVYKAHELYSACLAYVWIAYMAMDVLYVSLLCMSGWFGWL